MGSYFIHPRAEIELWEIWQFIARNNLEAATRVIAAAEETFQLLASNPGLGRPRHFRRKAYRTVRSLPVTGFKN